MFRAQFFDDFCAGCRIVAQCFCADGCFKSVHHFFREACFCVCGERIFCDDAGDFPMACSRIFTDGFFTHLAIAAFWCVYLAQQMDIFALDIAQTQRSHIGQACFGSCLFDVYQCVAANIAEIRRIGQFTDTNAVQHDNDCSFHMLSPPV